MVELNCIDIILNRKVFKAESEHEETCGYKLHQYDHRLKVKANISAEDVYLSGLGFFSICYHERIY